MLSPIKTSHWHAGMLAAVDPDSSSGRQEWLENLVNQYIQQTVAKVPRRTEAG